LADNFEMEGKTMRRSTRQAGEGVIILAFALLATVLFYALIFAAATAAVLFVLHLFGVV
jgi:hypothetical protein